MLHEISRQYIPTTKNEEASISWHNSILTVRTEKGIQLFDFTYNLQSLEKKIEFRVSFIPTPTSSPASGMFPDKYLKRELRNLDYTQMIIDPALWPHNPVLTQEMTSIAAFEWSPSGAIYNTESILATLNNIGNVNLFGPERYRWTSLIDLSAVVKKHFNFPEVSSSVPESFEHLKTAVDIVETSAIVWGPKLKENLCYFVTAQKNGNILIWLLQSQGCEIVTNVQFVIVTEVGEIISLLWICLSSDSFILICSNVMGQIFAFNCIINEKKIEMVKTTCLWKHKDRMIAKYLTHMTIDDRLILICNKNRHVLVEMFDKDCNILTQVVKIVNDYRITDISKSKNGLFLTTVNFKIYKIDISSKNDTLEVNLNLLKTKDPFTNYELYGISFSANSVICALAILDRKIMCRKTPAKLEIVLMCTNPQEHTELTLLFENPSNKLLNYWDCIELLRYKTSKLRALPSMDFQFYEDGKKNIYMLKLYFILLTLYKSLDKAIFVTTKAKLPETSLDVVWDEICASHSASVVNDMYNSYQSSNPEIQSFKLECYVGAKKYLKYFCDKYKRPMDQFVPPNILSLTKMETQYICQCCDENIEGFLCTNGHLNMFCCVTFTPIESNNYLVCKGCGSTARNDLKESSPMCMFCDLYLNYCYLP